MFLGSHANTPFAIDPRNWLLLISSDSERIHWSASFLILKSDIFVSETKRLWPETDDWKKELIFPKHAITISAQNSCEETKPLILPGRCKYDGEK